MFGLWKHSRVLKRWSKNKAVALETLVPGVDWDYQRGGVRLPDLMGDTAMPRPPKGGCIRWNQVRCAWDVLDSRGNVYTKMTYL